MWVRFSLSLLPALNKGWLQAEAAAKLLAQRTRKRRSYGPKSARKLLFLATVSRVIPVTLNCKAAVWAAQRHMTNSHKTVNRGGNPK